MLICICTYIHIYIYIYRERERERERGDRLLPPGPAGDEGGAPKQTCNSSSSHCV